MAFPRLGGHSEVGLAKASVSHGVGETPCLMHTRKEGAQRALSQMLSGEP